MPKTFKFLRWSGKKAVAFLVLTVVLSVAAVGSTLAYIIVKTNSLENQFTPPNIDIEIAGDEIANRGDIPVYVRAAIVVNWVDAEGNILSATPELEELTLGEGWKKGSDGFYYYTSALAVGTTAPKLIASITPPTSTPDGYTLRIQVLSSAIQSTPAEAVVERWAAVTGVSGGALVIN